MEPRHRRSTLPGTRPAGRTARSGHTGLSTRRLQHRTEDIARRRRSGHIALGATAALWSVLALIDAPPATRLVVGVPATIAASGYLQAHLRFCAGFGSRGLYNFGPVGPRRQVDDPEARRLDRRKATRIGAGSLAIGVMAGVLAAALPLTRR